LTQHFQDNKFSGNDSNRQSVTIIKNTMQKTQIIYPNYDSLLHEVNVHLHNYNHLKF